jgi:hypothetical protein
MMLIIAVIDSLGRAQATETLGCSLGSFGAKGTLFLRNSVRLAPNVMGRRVSGRHERAAAARYGLGGPLQGRLAVQPAHEDLEWQRRAFEVLA